MSEVEKVEVQSQHHGYQWPGDMGSYSINSHGINLFILENILGAESI